MWTTMTGFYDNWTLSEVVQVYGQPYHA